MELDEGAREAALDAFLPDDNDIGERVANERGCISQRRKSKVFMAVLE